MAYDPRLRREGATVTSYDLQGILTIVLMMLYPIAWAVVIYAIYRALSRITKDRM